MYQSVFTRFYCRNKQPQTCSVLQQSFVHQVQISTTLLLLWMSSLPPRVRWRSNKVCKISHCRGKRPTVFFVCIDVVEVLSAHKTPRRLSLMPMQGKCTCPLGGVEVTQWWAERHSSYRKQELVKFHRNPATPLPLLHVCGWCPDAMPSCGNREAETTKPNIFAF